ncbi:DnaD domain protein [Columbia Basin potato purple top phytoplasma]|uniref:DnaD domain protein n=1 Tax=Columbia Basin potato purple top phytoplasma TaxID=307134 RepID=A0ABT5L879_9MOLU|nr:DnaD domain protein [Columbia Basin potato purple top phytoplasma]MDC9031886.1 DnaD domain protein [Columbia Basin potato purple top phytoplasma]
MQSLQKFNIKNNSILTNEEQKTLHLLYQPLIGVGALNLYNTFYFLNQNFTLILNYNHQFLFDLLNIDEFLFIQYKEKLEAVNILQTFQNSKQEKIYFLQPPLNYIDFFKDPIFNQYLFSEIGENLYAQLINLFNNDKNKISLDNYENISKNFSDIYRFQEINLPKTINNNLKHLKNNKSFVSLQKHFDYKLFIEKLPQRFKQPFLLEFKSIEYITKLSFVYDINPEKMATLYQDIFRNNYDENIDLNNLKITLNRKYFKKNIILKNVKNINNEENEMILYLKNTNPNRIIQNFTTNHNIYADLCDITFKLMAQTETDIGVINALLMYVLKLKTNTNKSFVPNFNYFKTILNSWTKKGIISAETAFDFLIEEKEFQNDKPYKKNRPKWLDEVKEELGFNN